jgi:hypothetical protein
MTVSHNNERYVQRVLRALTYKGPTSPMMHYGPVRTMASSTFHRKIILFFFKDSILKSKIFLQKKKYLQEKYFKNI